MRISPLISTSVLAGLSAIVVVSVITACGGGEQATSTSKPIAAATVAAAPTPTKPPPTPTAAALSAGKLRVTTAGFGSEAMEPSVNSASGPWGIYAAPMYDWLVWNDKDGVPVPGIANKWQMAPDGKSWVFTIRPDMKFHNGDPLGPEDVQFSISRMLRPEASTASIGLWRANVASAEIVGPATVKVNLKNPWPIFDLLLVSQQGAEGVVIPKTYWELAGGEKGFAAKPIGTGPWRLVRHDVSVRFVFEAVSTKHSYRPLPFYKELELQAVPEESTRVAMLKTGTTDIIDVGFDTALSLRKENLKILTIDDVAGGVVFFSGLGDPRVKGMPTEKKDVRAALVLATNRQEMVDTLMGGLGSVAARTLVAPGSLGYDPTWKPHPYNPAQARQLLNSAGYAQGFGIRLYTAPIGTAPWLTRAAEAVAGYWSQVGVKAEVRNIEYGAILGIWRSQPQQPEEFIGQSSTTYTLSTPSNLAYLQVMYHAKGILRVWPTEEMNGLIDRANVVLDSAERVNLIQQVVALSHDNYLTVPLAYAPNIYAAGPGIDSWQKSRALQVGVLFETVVPKR